MAAFSLTSCFPCLSARKKEVPRSAPTNPHTSGVAGAVPRTFSFEELATVTRNFSDKGYMKSINQVVAIKLQHAVDPSGSPEQHNREFLAHALTMSGLRHPNVVNLIGFCADGHHRILVHEYMSGSLEDAYMCYSYALHTNNLAKSL
ncbi:putative serine/threonine-protein kinase RLCKVII [Hordeum vulgare]|nr:putative serine/threonine-protein kinase RLCKVII [Hordeum vulgare]